MSIGIADACTSGVHNDDETIRLIQRALDLGVSLLDTADTTTRTIRLPRTFQLEFKSVGILQDHAPKQASGGEAHQE